MTTFKYTKIPNTTDSITLPAGKYYIGDLCYVFEDEEWDNFFSDTLNQPDEGQHRFAITNGGFEVNGKKLWYHGTAYGDGGYPDQNGHIYSVDAGLIGVLPFELVVHKYENLYRLGNVVEYDYDFECSYEDGTFYIGPLRIPTGDDEEDYDGDYVNDDYEDQ
jgi:hypothetical protein